MHMADALLSPGVGFTFLAASGGALAYSAKKLKEEAEERKAPLMGVLGAFVFAAQMINFSIPGTGSSGHLGGGLMLAFLLGPYAAFLVMASVLIVQALIFADGGLLALGTNIWNLGFYPALVWWLLTKAAGGKRPTPAVLSLYAVIGAIAALELGALSVAVETVLSGRSELPFGRFALVMTGIHLPIGLVEGLVTAAVLNFVHRVRPELVLGGLTETEELPRAVSLRLLIVTFTLAALFTGGILVWFASAYPDGLEWTIQRITGKEELPPPQSKVASALARLQEKTSLLPDYDFKTPAEPETASPEAKEEAARKISPGTSISGIFGAIIVMTIVVLIGMALVKLRGTPSS